MIYFDNAATTWPKPDSVSRAVYDCLTGMYGNPGRGGHRLSLAAADAVYDCRAAVAEMFGSEHPENVVFTYNDTYALNTAIKSLAVRGSHMLISGIEHNSVLRPAAALSARGTCYSVYEVSTDEEQTLRRIREGVRPDTRIIVANHGSNICGLRLPIKKIGGLCEELRRQRLRMKRQTPLYFIVDAAQTAGCTDIDINDCGIDILCASGHKGLYGPQGSGFLIFGDRIGEDPALLASFIEGGSGVSSAELNMPLTLPERFEAGTLSVPAIMGLKKGIEFVSERGASSIYDAQRGLGLRLTDMITGLRGAHVYMPEYVGGTVLFNIDGIPSEKLAAALDSRGICVRAGLHCSPLAHKTLGTRYYGAVRASFGAFNTCEETDCFYRELKDILKTV